MSLQTIGTAGKLLVGIDASLTGTAVCWGWENIVGVVALPSPPAAGLVGRMMRFTKLVDTVITTIKAAADHCGANVALVGIEGYSMHSKGSAVTDICEYGGLLRSALVGRWRTIELPPASIKKLVTGKGNADKTAMAMGLFKRFNLEYDGDNKDDKVDASGCWYMLAGMAGAPAADGFTKAMQEEVSKQMVLLEPPAAVPTKKARKK